MKTFQIKEKSEETGGEREEPKPWKFHHDGNEQIDGGKGEAKENVRHDAHPERAQKVADQKEKVVKEPAEHAASDADEHGEDLARVVHLRSFWKNLPFAAPYLIEEISPLAANAPVPCENASTLSLEPAICTFTPFTVSAIAFSEKASTLPTPVIEMRALFSMVRTLSFSACCMLPLYAAKPAKITKTPLSARFLTYYV